MALYWRGGNTEQFSPNVLNAVDSRMHIRTAEENYFKIEFPLKKRTAVSTHHTQMK